MQKILIYVIAMGHNARGLNCETSTPSGENQFLAQETRGGRPLSFPDPLIPLNVVKGLSHNGPCINLHDLCLLKMPAVLPRTLDQRWQIKVYPIAYNKLSHYSKNQVKYVLILNTHLFITHLTILAGHV